MTDPATTLAAVRRGLDVAAQQATAATEATGGSWQWRGGTPVSEHVVAWNPARVLAVVGSLRTICDGIEETLERHAHLSCYGCKGKWPCPDYTAAVASLAGLAAVWAPTEQETP